MNLQLIEKRSVCVLGCGSEKRESLLQSLVSVTEAVKSSPANWDWIRQKEQRPSLSEPSQTGGEKMIGEKQERQTVQLQLLGKLLEFCEHWEEYTELVPLALVVEKCHL
jgi:hypothetical protein